MQNSFQAIALSALIQNILLQDNWGLSLYKTLGQKGKTMNINSYDNLSIYYDIVGTGPKILLLHGFGNDSTVWIQTGLIEKLKHNFTVITMDFRGCGKSDKPVSSESYSLDAHCMDIKKILTVTNTEKIILWGWSLGATVALHFSKENANIVKSAFIAGTYFGPIFTDTYIEKRISETTSLIDKARLNGFKKWPIVNPNEIKIPFLVYTGTNDGNVVIQIKKQEEEITKAGGIVKILDNVDHYGLINEYREIEEQIIPTLLKYAISPTYD